MKEKYEQNQKDLFELFTSISESVYPSLLLFQFNLNFYKNNNHLSIPLLTKTKMSELRRRIAAGRLRGIQSLSIEDPLSLDYNFKPSE